jgi:dTDP-4-amino-4,6-dideoxygalactose transaminase
MIWRCDLVPQYLNYQSEIDAAIKGVLMSGRYILAAETAKFEEEFRDYLGVKHVLGVANGTDALCLALRALDIGPGDEVITTPFTAIPTVSAIIDIGATPVFVDIREDTFLIDIDKVKKAITKRTKAVMPVHIFGNVVDIPALREAIGDGIAIIEDACQAHGSELDGKKAGSMGDISAFSFYPTKNVGGYGDGGAVATDRAELAERVKLLRMYGMVDYNHIVINGINSRLDELQAAILRVKLRHLDEMNERRKAIADKYGSSLPPGRFKVQAVPSRVKPNYHVYCVVYKGNRDGLIRYLDGKQVQTNIYYLMPIYLQEANNYLGLKSGHCPVAEHVCDHILALPMYPELASDTQDLIISEISSHKG